MLKNALAYQLKMTYSLDSKPAEPLLSKLNSGGYFFARG